MLYSIGASSPQPWNVQPNNPLQKSIARFVSPATSSKCTSFPATLPPSVEVGRSYTLALPARGGSMIRVFVVYQAEPDPALYERHAELCRSVEGGTFRHG